MIKLILLVIITIAIIGFSLWGGMSITAIQVAREVYKQHKNKRLLKKRIRLVVKYNFIVIPVSAIAIVGITRKSNDLNYVVGSSIFNGELLKTLENPLIGALALFMIAVLLVSVRLMKELGGKYSEYI